jgi:hypothetical protein
MQTVRDIGRAALLGLWLGIAILAGFIYFAVAVPGAPVRGPCAAVAAVAVILAVITEVTGWLPRRQP